MKGYHQFSLEEDCQILTTCFTPFSRSKFVRAPYSISSRPKQYNQRMYEAFQMGLVENGRIVDDIVIYDSDPNQHTEHVRQFLQWCAKQKITLNPDKWEFARSRSILQDLNLRNRATQLIHYS